jgi:succinate dehydrogenase / fumarate reductase iron-sulfur subunit
MSEVIFHIRRYQPGKDAEPYYQEFRVPLTPGLTVLDGLWHIKETQDPTLAWRFSCRMGICGSCGMLINGRARLACNTQIAELGAGRVCVAPLPNFEIIRDLVPDLQPMFRTHKELMPYIVREDGLTDSAQGEFIQTQEDLERYLQFSYCIKCGCCMAACPTVASDREYAGPMPLAQAYRYNQDSRDKGFLERKKVLGSGRGPWRCHYAGECSRVCPKGVDPARAIQLMKRELFLDVLRLRRAHRDSPCAGKPTDAKRREGIPEAPKPTVR